ncbi:MAG: hypothetical protein IPK80_12405 [Nannocystis sp.]|nr:hypothetical protein [Nannocystis sp.]
MLPALGLFFGISQTASAAETTRVASSFDEGNPFDLHFGVGYDYEYKKAAILREWSDGQTNWIARDLLYRQQRHTVMPSLEIGLYKDIAIYANLPIVVSDARSYSFDQEADPCVYSDQVNATNPVATCVNRLNSTSIRDGIIPRDGFDGTNTSDPYGAFSGSESDIFRGPVRRGFDQVHVGLKIGILSQQRLSHMPHWVIGLEGRFAVGKPMTFSRDIINNDPAGNHRVGRGVHELGLWTALSHRYRFLDPFFTAYWYQGVRAGNTEFRNLSAFGAQTKVNPQSMVGVSFGTEIVPFERKAKSQKFALELRGLAMLRYGGRGYSEAWELLSDSPALVGTNDPATGQCSQSQITQVVQYAKSNPEDSDYINNSGATGCVRFNGITDIQDFATFGFRGGINANLSKTATLQLGVNATTDTRHFISSASRGDADAVQGGDPERVDPGTAEVNPVRRDVIDNVGRRYMVDDVWSLTGYFRFLLTF